MAGVPRSGTTTGRGTMCGRFTQNYTWVEVGAVLDLAGWSRPWDAAREVEIPDRYLSDRRATSLARDDGGPDVH